MDPQRIVIVGVGLIGASIGLAMRRLGHNVSGIGRRATSLDTAQRVGAIDRGATWDSSATLSQLIADHVTQISRQRPQLLITDAGSSKSTIVAQVESQLGGSHRFVASHPIAGSHFHGPEHGSADLFVGKRCIVTPGPSSDEQDVERVEQFWQALQMKVERLEPAAHDRLLAQTSHLPHLVACALASIIDPADLRFAGTGFQDATRIAGGSPAVWTAIFDQNHEAVLKSLDQFSDRIAQWRTALLANDVALIERLLTDGKRTRDLLGS